MDAVKIAAQRGVKIYTIGVGDPEAAGERWGRREGSGPFHVVVKGSGRVRDVDTSSRAGLARLDTQGKSMGVRFNLQPLMSNSRLALFTSTPTLLTQLSTTDSS